MEEIDRELQDARRLLIDLTGRNRFLNYRQTKKRTIPILEQASSSLYGALVIEQRSMSLLPQDATDRDAPDPTPDLNPGKGAGRHSSQLQPSNERNADLRLTTPFLSDQLHSRLVYVYRQAKTIMEEQGYTGLYLALGFLKWSGAPSSMEYHKAPLLLIPIELQQYPGARFKGKWTNEDIQCNYALQVKLEEQGIQLPDFQMKDTAACLAEYIAKVSDAIEGCTGWKIEHSVYLDFFNFTKMIMYRDLDPTAWPDHCKPVDSRLLQLLFDPRDQPLLPPRFSEAEIDRKLDFRTSYHVLDADPSQIAVIEDAKTGHNLVVEGPPGTGKSQTIVNLIAELLAAGKKVLFVSEKGAALDVVKQRLDKVGRRRFLFRSPQQKSQEEGLRRCTPKNAGYRQHWPASDAKKD